MKEWRERDGVWYAANLVDKIYYAWRYHRNAVENTTTIISAIVGVAIVLTVLR